MAVLFDDETGVQAFIYLQHLVGVAETEASARVGWSTMRQGDRANMIMAYQYMLDMQHAAFREARQATPRKEYRMAQTFIAKLVRSVTVLATTPDHAVREAENCGVSTGEETFIEELHSEDWKIVSAKEPTTCSQ